jgi:hypothetical protein
MSNEPNSDILTASEYTVEAAKKELKRTLDYSIDSFKNLEFLIQHVKARFTSLKNEGKLSEQTVQSASVSIGAYLGEVIRRHHGGAWIAKNPIMKTLVINGQEFSPILYIFQRLTKDSDFSLENYWSDIHQNLYSQEKIEDKPPALEPPVKTAKGSAINRGLIIGGVLGIVILCVLGMVSIRIYSNIRATNEFKAKLNNFIVEANKINSMTEQGVNYNEFRSQLIEVKSAYALIKNWPSSYHNAKDAFDKAIEGWNLTLDVWKVQLDDEYGFTNTKNEELLKSIAKYLGMDSSKVDAFTAGLIPAKDWIGELMGQASTYFEAGIAGAK